MEMAKLPTDPQILAGHLDAFMAQVDVLAKLGCRRVNWNLACPYPMVMRKKQGAALLDQPETVDRILVEVLPKTGVKLSVKMRLGREQDDECLAILDVLNGHELAEVVIHPRTARQRYDGRPELDRFAQCAEACRHPVVYNGDITDSEGFAQLQQRFPQVQRWMVGRGALADPFLPTSLRQRQWSPQEKVSTLAAFHDALVEHYQTQLSGDRHVLDKLKGLWAYLAPSFSPGLKARKRIVKATTLARYSQVVDHLLSRRENWNPGESTGELGPQAGPATKGPRL
jgi:tRNA-dihydrouridine synthase